MRAVVARVSRASVTVTRPDGAREVTGAIGEGLLVLLGVHRDDVRADAAGDTGSASEGCERGTGGAGGVCERDTGGAGGRSGGGDNTVGAGERGAGGRGGGGDTPAGAAAGRAEAMARKLHELRLLRGVDGGPERSCAESGAPLLVVSQFTLYGDTRKGRRPSWSAAARPEDAAPVVDDVVARLRARGATVETGEFGAMMDVESVNDGPYTVLIDT